MNKLSCQVHVNATYLNLACVYLCGWNRRMWFR